VAAYKVLPRPQFSQLQEKIFPIYFGMQTVLPAILALTYPGPRNPLGAPSGIQGTFAEVNRWSVLIPLGTMFLSGLANMLYIGQVILRAIEVLFCLGLRALGARLCSKDMPQNSRNQSLGLVVFLD
jgi:hypothetical protein